MRKARWPGEWWAICDSCGLKFPSGDMRKRWDGLMVCKEDYEPRHPQDLLRVRPEHITPPWVRPEPPDQFKTVCNIWESSPYADLAAADCAHADIGSPPLSYQFLLDTYNDHFIPLYTTDLIAPGPYPAPPAPAPSPGGNGSPIGLLLVLTVSGAPAPAPSPAPSPSPSAGTPVGLLLTITQAS